MQIERGDHPACAYARAGHTVHATVRDPARNTEQLKALPGAGDRLKLFKADLTLPGR